jgi:hypothetical protein
MDCSVAAVAMALNITYEEALSALPGEAANGMYCADIFSWVKEKYEARVFSKRKHEGEWPPKPMAKAHICETAGRQNSLRGHFVFMDSDGMILDPGRDGRFEVSNYEIWRIIAIWPLPCV